MTLPTRRAAMTTAAAAAVAASSDAVAAAGPGVLNQSVCSWCFMSQGDKWSLDRTCQEAKALGCKSVELLGPDAFPTLAKHGLTCAIAGNGYPKPGFMYGFNNPAFHAELLACTTKVIEAAAPAKVPSVIAFVGYKWPDPTNPKSGTIPLDEAIRNCVKGLKELALVAEKHGVTVCVEHLNTRDASHPMKGHPGYQGDDLDVVAGIARQVGSPRVKVLFDVYHVQVMHGDVLRRLDQCADVLGHVHTAGNPGRGELDATQEINYPAVARKLAAMKYAGYVGHEFIPTRDARAGLAEAVAACRV